MQLIIHDFAGTLVIQWANGFIILVLLITTQILGLTSVSWVA